MAVSGKNALFKRQRFIREKVAFREKARGELAPHVFLRSRPQFQGHIIHAYMGNITVAAIPHFLCARYFRLPDSQIRNGGIAAYAAHIQWRLAHCRRARDPVGNVSNAHNARAASTADTGKQPGAAKPHSLVYLYPFA